MMKWQDILKIWRDMEVIAVGQISGAMGNFAHAPLELEEYAMAELGLKPEPCSNQVIHRDRYARLATVF